MTAGQNPQGGHQIALEPSKLLNWAAGFYLVLGLAGFFWLGASRESLGAEVFLGEPFEAQKLVMDLLGGSVLALVILLFWTLFSRTGPGRELEDELSSFLQPLRWDQAWALALFSGFSEEVFFRGAVQSAWGILPGAVLFALLHGGQGKAFKYWMVAALVIGLLFGYIVDQRSNLVAVVFAHILINAYQLRRLSILSPEILDCPPS